MQKLQQDWVQYLAREKERQKKREEGVVDLTEWQTQSYRGASPSLPNVSGPKRPIQPCARKLFNCDSPRPQLSNKQENNALRKRVLGHLNENITGMNDSNAEFVEYETLCKTPKDQASNICSLDVLKETRAFVQNKNEEMCVKIMKVIEDHKNAIDAKLSEIENLFSPSNKENIEAKKRKSGDLRRYIMGKSVSFSYLDTPRTAKVKKANELYNTMRHNLESPCVGRNMLRTPKEHLASEHTLSINLQKQCRALHD